MRARSASRAQRTTGSIRTATAQRPVFGAPKVAFLMSVPLAWAVLLWFHPSVAPDDVYGSLRDEVVTYQIVHTGTLVFIGLIGVALYLLVRDLPGRAARTTRPQVSAPSCPTPYRACRRTSSSGR